MARILLIDDDYSFVQTIRLILERAEHQVEFALDGQKGLIAAAQTQPDVVLLDIMMPNLTGYDVVQRLRQDPRTAGIRIVVLTARSQLMDRELALASGANAFLTKPVTANDLISRVAAVLAAPVDSTVNTGLLAAPMSRAAAPPLPTPDPLRTTASWIPVPPPVSAPRTRLPIGAEDLAQPADVPPAHQPVITVLGLRGGVGSTTLAVNLAVALRRREGRRITLVDLSDTGGHSALHLHVKPSTTWAALRPLGDLPDPRAVQQALMEHESSELLLLAAPPLLLDEGLSRLATQNVLRALAALHGFVVVDACSLNASVIGALQISCAVVIVMTDDPMSVQTTGQALAALAKLGLDPARVWVALNHVRPVFDIPLDSLQRALKRPLAANIPYDPNQMSAIRQGVPLVNASPDGAFAQAVQDLARLVTQAD